MSLARHYESERLTLKQKDKNMMTLKSIVPVITDKEITAKAKNFMNEMLDAYGGKYFFEIERVKKFGSWRTLESHFCGVLFGWEKEISNICFYIAMGFEGVAIRVTDFRGNVVVESSEFLFHGKRNSKKAVN